MAMLILNIKNNIYFFLYGLEVFSNTNLNLLMINALVISLKFLTCIALLIFARGGIPRFRFDYLTKLG